MNQAKILKHTKGQNVPINANRRGSLWFLAVNVPPRVKNVGVVSPDFRNTRSALQSTQTIRHRNQPTDYTHKQRRWHSDPCWLGFRSLDDQTSSVPESRGEWYRHDQLSSQDDRQWDGIEAFPARHQPSDKSSGRKYLLWWWQSHTAYFPCPSSRSLHPL